MLDFSEKIMSKQTSNINSSLSLAANHVTGLFTCYLFTEILYWTPDSLQKRVGGHLEIMCCIRRQKRPKGDNDGLKLLFAAPIWLLLIGQIKYFEV